MDDAFILLMYFIGFFIVMCLAAGAVLIGRFLYYVFLIMWLSMAGIFSDIKRSIQS